MIIGIGTDIVNIERIQHIFDRFGDDFVKKNFHELEIENLSDLKYSLKISYLAKRFAAKEAMAKALGIGIGRGLSFKDIAVINNDFGAPQIIMPTEIYPDIVNCNVHVSLSDDHPFAVAFVTISK